VIAAGLGGIVFFHRNTGYELPDRQYIFDPSAVTGFTEKPYLTVPPDFLTAFCQYSSD